MPDLQATMIMSDDTTQARRDPGLAPEAPDARQMSRIGLESVPTHTGVPSRFGESTRQLLRARLMIAAAVFIAAMLIANIVLAFLGDMARNTWVTRTVAAGVLGIVLVWLRRNPDVSLSSLRWVELLVVLIPLTSVLLLLYTRTQLLAQAATPDRVPELRAQITSVACLIMTVYGFFIPNGWKRTAIVSLGIIALTTSAMWVHQAAQPALHNSDASDVTIHVIMVMLMVFFASVASLGSHVVHGIRRQVEKLKEYGQYRLLEEIGRGSMGVVHKAQHRMLKRPAAIKLIGSETASDKTAIARFEDEVQISATLSHWNTVQIYDYGQTDQGDFYYVMEYLDGEPLSTRLKRGGPLTVIETLSVIRQLCDGLEEAHAIGMIHRDLKPANIFLAIVGGQTDVVKILDFGLATRTQQASLSPASQHASIAQGICGTPSYMSPEQIRGEPLDGRSDQYALGCIFFECLTGNPAFPGETISRILVNHLEGQLPDPLSLSAPAAKFWPVIERCLAKDKANRFESVAALKAAIEACSPTP